MGKTNDFFDSVCCFGFAQPVQCYGQGCSKAKERFSFVRLDEKIIDVQRLADVKLQQHTGVIKFMRAGNSYRYNRNSFQPIQIKIVNDFCGALF